MSKLIPVEEIIKAKERLKGVVTHTPTAKNLNLSEKYGCTVSLKREDLQVVRSYKLRGAYNFMVSHSKEQLSNGVVCASAGNHAQGVAYSCRQLGVQGDIFMPETTPRQKVNQVKMLGKEAVKIHLTGDTFDDAYHKAIKYCEEEEKLFIHPFDDEYVMTGQGTVGLEIHQDMDLPIDYLFVPVGGGGLAAGVGSFFMKISPSTKIIGVEPAGAPAMYNSIKAGEVLGLESIDKFVDGAAVQKVGEKPFAICQELFGEIILVPEGKICTTMISLYQEEAIVVEPAGALTVAALDLYKDKIKGKNVVCIVSGGNNDIERMQEVKERSLIYEGLKHYFMIRFPQRAGALKEFLVDVLGPDDDITLFEYAKKNSRESGPAIVGIELKRKEDYEFLLKRMEDKGINYVPMNEDPNLFEFFV